MASDVARKFHLGDWLVEPDIGRVSRGEESATLRPREMDLLVYFAGRPGEVLRTDDIIRDVWSGVHVTNDSLYFSISQLRKVLDDKESGGSVIETIPKRGYRLTANVVPAEAPPAVAESPPESAGEAAAPPTEAFAEAPADSRPASPGAAAAAPSAGNSRRAIPVAAAVVLGAAGLLWFSLAGDNGDPVAETGVAVETSDASSIAVMPFIDLTPETDYTYFSDGITEEILNRLTRIPGLRVAARTSSFTFKDSSADVIEIGQSLGVANLLEGSVRKEGDRVRVSVQLIDALSGFQLWSDSYDRQLTSVFEIQNEISRRVADALEITLSAAASGGDEADRPASPDVLDEYLMGLEALRTQSFDSLAAAVDHFETVLERDPSFNSARVQLAFAKLELLNTGARSDLALVEDAESLVRAALDEDPDSASAHRVMGLVQKWQGDAEEARRELELALTLAPSDSAAMSQLAHLLVTHGEEAEARQLLQRALRIDPFSNDVLRSYGMVERQFGAIDSAEEALQRAVDLHPDNPNSYWMLGSLQARERGHIATGLDYYRIAAELDPADYEIAAYVAATYQTLGMHEEAQPWIRRAEEDAPRAPTTLAVLAIRDALNGRNQTAMEMSLEALEENSYRMYMHGPITRAFLPVVVRNAIDSAELASTIARLEGAQSGYKLSSEVLASREGLDSMLAYSDLARHWLVSLATLYKSAGMDEKLGVTMDALALTRIEALDEFRDELRNDDYLVEAEARALEGDADGAFDMLAQAVDNHLLYLWQFSYEINPAFASLHDDPRWQSLMERIRRRIDAERQLATTTLGMAAERAAEGLDSVGRQRR